MARGVNKVILIGNLGKDPEVRYIPNGNAVTEIKIATSESWKDKTSGEKKEQTEWHRLVFYNKLAEIVGEYLKKGSKIYVEGKLNTQEWIDEKSGMRKYATRIICHEMQMLDSAPKDGLSYKPPAPETSSSAPNDFDDDIPF